MSSLISLREHARLTTEPVPWSLDQAQIPATAFDWLCQLNARFSQAGASLVQVEDRRWLRLDQYVGVLETPCGTRLEILPKHLEAGDDLRQGRQLLQRLIRTALELPAREAGPARLAAFDQPLAEWLIGQFLEALQQLLQRGLRADYHRQSSLQPVLRGQLELTAQLRQPPGRPLRFQVCHDQFVPDSPENRLLRLALERAGRHARSPDNSRLARQLQQRLAAVPPSRQPEVDFRAWRHDRLHVAYQPLRPWCELILNQQLPLAVAGDWPGLSLLFPMERLFERQVTASLSRQLQPGARLSAQSARHFLCQHDGRGFFRLRPDLLIEQDERCWVLDCKWKRLDCRDQGRQYGLEIRDFYQLLAYGQSALDGPPGGLVLIYPRHAGFTGPLPVFQFARGLSLWVLPFDLQQAQLLGAGLAGLPLQPESP